MEYFPIFTTQQQVSCKSIFNVSSVKEKCELYETIRDFLSGPCMAVVVTEEIIYNTYIPRTASVILNESLLLSQFIKYPHLLIVPFEKLKIVIYYPAWCVILTFNDGYYKLAFYQN